jgi:L-methionine (R)-S-oxide reductase
MGLCAVSNLSNKLLLGPFCGKPACQSIDTTPGRGQAVFTDAFISCRTIVVLDVEAYPGHIACDEQRKSEIVCPLILRSLGKRVGLGVFDPDCLTQAGFVKTIVPAWRR